MLHWTMSDRSSGAHWRGGIGYRTPKDKLLRRAGAICDEIVVYSVGTLFGEWLDGEPFDGDRYIDQFTIKGGNQASIAERRQARRFDLCR
jgi:hypothetical protein